MLGDIRNVFRSQHVASSGLYAARRWMETVTNNIVNKESVDTGKYDDKGNFIPYKRQVPVFAKVLFEDFRDNRVRGDVENGVTVKEIAELQEVEKVYNPNHPAARRAGSPDAGYVYHPKVDLATEMANEKMAGLFYEACITALSVGGKMFDQALTIGKGT